jgi:YHS domain-containing protein
VKAIDLVCKWEVEEKGAEMSSFQGKNYYFCGVECKSTFDSDPKKYA